MSCHAAFGDMFPHLSLTLGGTTDGRAAACNAHPMPMWVPAVAGPIVVLYQWAAAGYPPKPGPVPSSCCVLCGICLLMVWNQSPVAPGVRQHGHRDRLLHPPPFSLCLEGISAAVRAMPLCDTIARGLWVTPCSTHASGLDGGPLSPPPPSRASPRRREYAESRHCDTRKECPYPEVCHSVWRIGALSPEPVGAPPSAPLQGRGGGPGRSSRTTAAPWGHRAPPSRPRPPTNGGHVGPILKHPHEPPWRWMSVDVGGCR